MVSVAITLRCSTGPCTVRCCGCRRAGLPPGGRHRVLMGRFIGSVRSGTGWVGGGWHAWVHEADSRFLSWRLSASCRPGCRLGAVPSSGVVGAAGRGCAPREAFHLFLAGVSGGFGGVTEERRVFVRRRGERGPVTTISLVARFRSSLAPVGCASALVDTRRVKRPAHKQGCSPSRSLPG